jgi:hypothetical protein
VTAVFVEPVSDSGEGTLRGRAFKLLKAGLAAVMLLTSVAADAAQLITEEEAKLPPPKGATAADRRGILRGPKVEFVSPREGVRSPIHLQLKFEAYGGAKIDPESVKMVYLRTPNVDLTPRVKQFVQASGINIPDSELPPGEFMISVDVTDSDGRPGSTSFVLMVWP